VRGLPLPDAEIIDGRGQKGETLLPGLAAALADNLTQGGQSLLFLNRRGFATFLICRDCGYVFHCPNCSVTLTYHRIRQRHYCHYCDFSIPAPSVCPDCGSAEIGLLGRGTERVEEEVKALLPEARVARMDSDTTSGRGGHARILKKLEDGGIDILIGTQMITKGHDYPGVTLVGVISADTALNLPDFRSAERTFQMISQVTGRAGRGDAPGKVLIQSLSPDHYALVRAAGHDYAGFYTDELEFRREAGYPPFSFLATVNLSGTSAEALEKSAEHAARLLRDMRRLLKTRTEILGPAPAPLAKVRGRYRRQILLKSSARRELNSVLAAFRNEFKLPPTVRMNLDVDPVDMM
jgi:primosomal protein N' (replication factor Y)